MPPRRSAATANILAELQRLREENEKLWSELRSVRDRSSAREEDQRRSRSTWKIAGTDAKESIPKFYPGDDSAKTAAYWIDTVENLMSAHNWEQQQALYYAQTRLRGAAQDW